MKKIDLFKDPVMTDMRKSIDLLDISFLRLISERMRVADKILFIKSQKKMDLNQTQKHI